MDVHSEGNIGNLSVICKLYENLKAQEEVGEVEKSLDYSFMGAGVYRNIHYAEQVVEMSA